jgi:hypothetical protein
MLSLSGGDLGCGKAVFTAGEQALAFLSLQGMPGLSLRGKGQERLLAKRRNVKQKKEALRGAGHRFAASRLTQRPADGASLRF